ncbi:hypothetical protein [Vibrio sp. 1CM23M]|uniref:hypothetical protein n=1 Tax=Vibrio sp. 1CM23M TaxID=2929164 RepID=UPI0020BFC290|nr:hypothetical protein [Vibrio sp. 1CM23M]MCK8072222.1 hypothetical protein [Vibrio sp. 1CM23M]
MNIAYFFPHVKLSDFVFYVLMIFTILPVWLYEFPAMIDFPQHIAQLSVLKALVFGNDFYGDLYKINWFTPYIITNLFLLFFTLVFSPVIALKIGITFYLFSIPLFTGLIAKKINKQEDIRILTIPFLYCLPFNWGFIPFLIAIGFSVIWLYYFIVCDNNPNSFINIIFSFFIIYSHAIAWGLIMVYIFFICFKDGFNLYLVKGILKILSPLVFIIIWLVSLKSDASLNMDEDLFTYHSVMYRFFSLIGANLMGNDKVFGFIKFCIIYYLIRECFLFKLKGNIYAKLSCLSVIIFLILPNRLVSTGFFSDRLLILLPVFFALSISEIKSKRKLYLLTSIAVALSVIPRVNRVIESNENLNVVYKFEAFIDDRSRLIFLSNNNDYSSSDYKILPEPYFLWIPQMLVVKKELEIDFNFAYFHPEMVRFSNEVDNNVKNFSSRTRYDYPEVKWENYTYYDYVLIRDCSFLDNGISRELPKGSFVIGKTIGCWTLLIRNV